MIRTRYDGNYFGASGYHISGTTHDAEALATEQSVTLQLEGRSYSFLASVVRHAILFNEDSARGAYLGHDCSVFAYACEQDQTERVAGVNYTAASWWMIRPRHIKTISHQAFDPTIGPTSAAGDIVFTSDARRGHPSATRHHYAVRATTEDENSVWYISKFGRRKVFISSYQALTRVYPAVRTGRASNFRRRLNLLGYT